MAPHTLNDLTISNRAAAYPRADVQTIPPNPRASAQSGERRIEHSAGYRTDNLLQGTAERLDTAVLREVLEELDTGVIVCNEEGHVALANDAARRELQLGQPLALDSAGVLKTRCPLQWRAALRGAVRGRRQMLPLRTIEHSFMVSVLPLGGMGSSWVLVLMGRRQPAPDLAVDMLGKLCKLTDAERQVLGRLLAGVRVEEVACERGVKVSTLRTQVAALRSKLGAERLEDLVRIVAELPPMTGVLRSPALGMRAAGAMEAA